MELVKVRNQLTLEEQWVRITLSKEQYTQLAGIPALTDEKDYYTSIINQVSDKSLEVREGTSRQFLVQNQECISTLQFMMSRTNSSLNVFMRSSDVKRLPSDLGFLSRLAIKYSVDRINISISSLHIIIGDLK